MAEEVTREEVAVAASAKGLVRPKIVPFKARGGAVLFKLKYGPDSDRRETDPNTLTGLMQWLDAQALAVEAPSPP